VSADLRQMRYFVAVAEHGNFTRAAEELHVAQQAVSQQVRALEATMSVTLLRRSSRKVELTPEGAVFLAEAKRVLAASDRAVRRTQAAARGETGTLRVVYTVIAAYETAPAILELLARRHPELKLSSREVYGGDAFDLLRAGRADVGLVAMAPLPAGLRQRLVRREILRLAVADGHELAGRDQVELAELEGESFEVWPRQVAPGYYDVVVGACRSAGFEPPLTEDAGATLWCRAIARGRGVGLAVSSMAAEMPAGITLVDLGPPRPTLAINAVWSDETESAAVHRFLDVAAALATQRGWY
jgi:DNA-binding transcriptional LysR family regulator